MCSKNIDNVLIEKPFISLMELQRKKELKKIMIQNNRLLDRIQTTVPSYDHVSWEKEAKHHVEILKNMTEFPDLFVAPGTHKKGYDMAIIDAERAAAKAQKKNTAAGMRASTASPEKGRSQKGSSPTQEMHSPGSMASKNSAFVPYSYFPEEQYAEYQRQLLVQQQALQQQQMYGTPVYTTPEQQRAQQQMFQYHQQQQQQQQIQQRQPYYSTAQQAPGPSNMAYPESGYGDNGSGSGGSGGYNGYNNGAYSGGPQAGHSNSQQQQLPYAAQQYVQPQYPQQQQQQQYQEGGVQLPNIYQNNYNQGAPNGYS